MHGQFTWYELSTSDPTAAQRFYPAVTGWSVTNWDQSPSDNPYRMWSAPDGPMAGLMPLSAEQKAMGAPSMWLPYIDVDNAQEVVRRATAMGAKVLYGPETMPQVGTFAALSDPQGAVFAVLQPTSRSPGFDGTPKLGHFSWHELLTTDMDSAWTFYQSLFGWKKGDSMDMGEAGRYQMYGQGGRSFGGMFNRSGRMAHVPPGWFLYVNVKDVKKSRDAAVKGGATIVLDVMDVPGGDQVAMFIDPQGACFAVHQVGPATPAAKTATKKAAKKTARKAARKTARKAAKKSTKKTARKGAKKSKRKAAPKRRTAKRAKRGKRRR